MSLGRFPVKREHLTEEYNKSANSMNTQGNVLLPGTGLPPGLEYLMSVSKLYIKQQVDWLDVFVGFEQQNKYAIFNDQGQKVYYAVEKSECLGRQCFGKYRPLEFEVFDLHMNKVISIQRPLACDSICFPCCLQNVEVSCPPGNIVGTVNQECAFFFPEFSVKDHVGETVLKIDGPFCMICLTAEFKVRSSNKEFDVGKIRKEFSGALREIFTDADTFTVSFPQDLDVRMKATLLGALFLIDMMYFEKSSN